MEIFAWSFIELGKVGNIEDPFGIQKFLELIPDSWLWSHPNGRYGKRTSDKLHTTVFLRIKNKEDVNELARISRLTKPFYMEVENIFLSHVDRIKEDEVYAIGIKLRSPGLRVLKDNWLSLYASEARQLHDPYGEKGDGHITIAYIQALEYNNAKTLVEENQEFFQGTNVKIESIFVYEYESSKLVELPFLEEE